MKKQLIAELFGIANTISLIGVGCAVVGIFFAFAGNGLLSVIMLILAGIADAFDGPIAKKTNKKGGKEYGVHVDSLVDIVSFGVLPVCICMALGFRSWIDLVVYVVFVICGIVRLAYYNLNSSKEEVFIGVPITTVSILIPFAYLLDKTSELLFMIMLAILSILFVVNIRVKKPTMKTRVVLLMLGIITIVCMILMMIGVI